MSHSTDPLGLRPEMVGTWSSADLPAEAYHALPGASPSQLSHFLDVTDAEARVSAAEIAESDNPVLMLGSLCHQMALEPGLPLPGMSLYPDSYISASGEVKPWHRGATACKTWEADQRDAGRICLTQEKWSEMLAMTRALMDHEIFARVTRRVGTQSEVSVIAMAQAAGSLMLRCRLDLVPEGEAWLADAKFTADPSPRGFPNHIIRMGYHVQAAIGLDLWNALNPSDHRDGWVIFAVGQKPPHLVVAYQLDRDMIEEGRRVYPELLARYERCHRTGVWAGYPEVMHPARLPAWVRPT